MNISRIMSWEEHAFVGQEDDKEPKKKKKISREYCVKIEYESLKNW